MDQKILLVTMALLSQTLNEFGACDSTMRHKDEAAGWSFYTTTFLSQTLNDFDAYDSTMRHKNEAAGWSFQSDRTIKASGKSNQTARLDLSSASIGGMTWGLLKSMCA